VANNYNVCPIKLDSTMASGWKALQTLNAGTLPATAQQLSGAVLGQPGIRVTKIIWENPTAVGHTFHIIDPVDSNILLYGSCDVAAKDIIYAFDNLATWKDFKVSQISSGTLYIWYRV
jgi:hypothetical protein